MNYKEQIFVEGNNQYAENEYFIGQRESRYNTNDQLINNQVDAQLNTLRHIFDWITYEQISELKQKILQHLKHNKQNVKTKYITTAFAYNLIKITSQINETECIQQLLNQFHVQSRKLLKHLRIIKNDDTSDFNKILQQLPYFKEKMKKYFYGQGQSLLLKLKTPNLTYQQLIDYILEENQKIIFRMFQLQLVKQYCVSKKPSRLIINLGYVAFQIQELYIIPGEYQRIFKITINSLRHFSKGLVNLLNQFVMKITGQDQIPKQSDKSQQISQTIINDQGEYKKITEESSQSEPILEIEGTKLQTIRKLFNNFDIYLFLLVDTEEEDELMNECESILKQM